jgi:hypothetical protein
MINMELRISGKEIQKKAGKVDPKRLYKWSCIGKFATQISLEKLASHHDSTLVSLFSAATS